MELKPGMRILFNPPADEEGYDYRFLVKHGVDEIFNKEVVIETIRTKNGSLFFTLEMFPDILFGLIYASPAPKKRHSSGKCPICGGPGEYLFQLFLCDNDKCQNGKGYMKQQQVEI
jgi:hypothetical protein